ncbi:MAG: 5-formyltetrahydrofolate cyclo-ligase [Clostridia bacterium]|nr:5-formyltetrahydrofolate cyclo-ligase [Clostridia bacterium]
MFEIRSEKNRLRKKYSEIREGIFGQDKFELDEKICSRILSLVSYRFADTLLLYSPVKSEIDITPIAVAALKAGKRVAFPRCTPEGSLMHFHYVSSLDELTPGHYSILEPSADAPVFDKKKDHSKESCLCLIPALIYDKNGYRIGYGKGYYDRYLLDFHGSKAGVIYDALIAESVPHGRFDLKVDFTVSEKGVNIIK